MGRVFTGMTRPGGFRRDDEVGEVDAKIETIPTHPSP
jgi:hypothetical protein